MAVVVLMSREEQARRVEANRFGAGRAGAEGRHRGGARSGPTVTLYGPRPRLPLPGLVTPQGCVIRPGQRVRQEPPFWRMV